MDNQAKPVGLMHFAALKGKLGRRMKYETVEELSARIEDYFADCEERALPRTMSGLAYHLEMSTESLRNYGERDLFSAVVRRAKQRVEIYLEQRLDGSSPTGAIFNLKNNFGWKDKTEQEHSGHVSTERIERTIVDPKNTDS